MSIKKVDFEKIQEIYDFFFSQTTPIYRNGINCYNLRMLVMADYVVENFSDLEEKDQHKLSVDIVKIIKELNPIYTP
jgi:hypothetical protein